MSHTTPLYIPLTEGLDLSKDATLSGRELQLAENVDWSVQGQVRGRPSRAAAEQFTYRTGLGNGVPLSPAYATGTFASTGFTALGLMRLRDGTDERAMLGCAGRLFANEGTTWRDRGHFACAAVDRLHTYYRHESTAVARTMVGPDFGTYSDPAVTKQVALLSPSTFGFERFATTTSAPDDVGGSARCGTTTAAVTRTGANLILVTRANGASSLTESTIATDAAATDDDGDAPAICCDHDQTAFFVAYQTTTANQYKVLKVTTAGSVSATFTGTLAGIHGQWVANSTAAGNTVVVGLTDASGLTVKVLNATTMADNSKDSTHGGAAGREVVVGVETSTRAWWAFRRFAGSTADVLTIGTLDPTTAASAVSMLQYFGGTGAGSRYHTAMHQPLLVSGRMYLTVANAAYPDSTSAAVGTWFTVDLSNLAGGVTAGATGPFSVPTLVARGALEGTALAMGTSGATRFQPESAVLWTDNTWSFASVDWTAYDQIPTSHEFSVGTATKGLKPITVLNRVKMSGPRCVTAGGATLFSGSVPRALAGDQCFEAGHPAGRPAFAVQIDGADGEITVAGDYTIYVLWAYTDGAGQVHRSNAAAFTQSLAIDDAVDLWIENPWFSERPRGDIRIEVYSTGANPTADSLAYLQTTLTPDFSAGATTHKLFDTVDVVTTTASLYILDGEFIHHTPSADGGIAALGRRVWTASSDTVFASLLMNPNEGVAWNDEGSLSVPLPAGAGRILALEGLDDKLIIFCRRGVYAIQDGGPANNGIGPDISFPIRLTDLGCAGARSTCVTDRGVVFCSPLDTTDPQRGGPWLLDRSLSLTDRKYLGSPALQYFLGTGSWVPETAFSPERQQLYVSVPAADGGSLSGVVVIDMRAGKWATWVHSSAHGTFSTMDCVQGVLWTKGTEVAPYSGAPGSDSDAAYQMRIKTGHLPSDGQNGLGWARCRSVSALGSHDSGAHTLTMLAYQDHVRTLTSDPYVLAAVATAGPSTTWPTARQAPEWRLPVQKSSTLQVELRASPATARWAAIRLDVQPLPRRAPASQRT